MTGEGTKIISSRTDTNNFPSYSMTTISMVYLAKLSQKIREKNVTYFILVNF